MKFDKGNRAIRDHEQNSMDIHIFEYVRTGCVKYIGQMIYIGHDFVDGIDINKNPRQLIVFHLVPVEDTNPGNGTELSGDRSILELRRMALTSSRGTTNTTESKRIVHERSQAIKLYALKRANGVCECCAKAAPFVNRQGDPFLEVHHIRRLSDGGPDHPEWVAAICPNCHREAHYGRHAGDLNNTLLEKIAEKERAYSGAW